jgi:hypothetical protein
MPCKVIPFPGAVKTVGKESILARHHIVFEVGKSRYDVDVLGFVTALQPAIGDGGRLIRFVVSGSGIEREPAVVVQVLQWSQSRRRGWRAVLSLKGSKRQWETYWKQLGIASPSPGGAAGKEAQNSLALGRRQSDESSCATSAQKEVPMTNAENLSHPRRKAPQAATPPSSGLGPPARATVTPPRPKGGNGRRPGAAPPPVRRRPGPEPSRPRRGRPRRTRNPARRAREP